MKSHLLNENVCPKCNLPLAYNIIIKVTYGNGNVKKNFFLSSGLEIKDWLVSHYYWIDYSIVLNLSLRAKLYGSLFSCLTF